MTQFRKQVTGFAAVAGACVALTGTAFGQGGDDPFSAVPLAIPGSDTGDTTQLTNQFDVVCPFTGSTSNDAWYSYSATSEDLIITLDLCASSYDTKVYVLDAGFNEVGCNDDFCTSFRSVLEVYIPANSGDYFIVVDGWLGENGIYDIQASGETPPPPCVLECPPDSQQEGEPCDEVTDVNGGCNSSPNVFTDIACGSTLCGIAWANGGTRDTDWFKLAPTANVFATVSVTPEFDSALFFLGIDPVCASIAVVADFSTGTCDTGSFGTDVLVGQTAWYFVGFGAFEGLPCEGTAPPQGNDYVMSISCGDAPCPNLGDLDADGDVDFQDLLTVLANWGDCP